MTSIDQAARVDPGAQIGRDVTVGPFCVIGPDVTIGDGCRLIAHVHVTGHTDIGRDTTIHPFASLGSPPQSVKYRGGPTRLVVGSKCDIREGVTINTGTEDDRGVTTVGDHCFFMVGSHIGHDCDIGNHVTMANNVVLGGHVQVGDNVFFGGQAAVHQFVRIGEGAMVGGLSGLRSDLIPYGYAIGQLADLVGLNVVGLKRRGVTKSQLHRIREAYRAIFFGEGYFRDRLARATEAYAQDPLVGKIIGFIHAGGSRPLMRPATSGAAAEAE